MAQNQSPIRFQTEQEKRPTLRIPRPIDVYQLQTTAAAVFTARSDADFQVESLVAANVTGSADYVTLYLVPSGGSVGADNMAFYQVAIAAKSYVRLFDRENMGLLQPGMAIHALCGVNDSVNMFGYGYDYQGIYS